MDLTDLFFDARLWEFCLSQVHWQDLVVRKLIPLIKLQIVLAGEADLVK